MERCSQCIIGASATSGALQAAKTLAAGSVGAEPSRLIELPKPSRLYQRPPLSKEILTGVKTLSDCGLFEASFLARREIELRAGARAAAIDRKQQEVLLEDGSSVPYGRLLLATGAEPRRLASPEVGRGDILYLRSAADASRLADIIRRRPA